MAHVVVDEDLCQGHAMCALEAPDVFEVPKKGTVRVVGEVTGSNAEAVRQAVRHCPTGALVLKES